MCAGRIHWPGFSGGVQVPQSDCARRHCRRASAKGRSTRRSGPHTMWSDAIRIDSSWAGLDGRQGMTTSCRTSSRGAVEGRDEARPSGRPTRSGEVGDRRPSDHECTQVHTPAKSPAGSRPPDRTGTWPIAPLHQSLGTIVPPRGDSYPSRRSRCCARGRARLSPRRQIDGERARRVRDFWRRVGSVQRICSESSHREARGSQPIRGGSSRR